MADWKGITLKAGEMAITPEFEAGIVPIPPHSGVFRRFAATTTLGDAEVRLAIEVDDRGAAACRRIEIAAERVSGDLLRRVPVGRLLARAMAAAHFRFGEPGDGAIRIDFGEGRVARFPTPMESAEFYERYARNARRPRRGSPLTEENLRDVAELYRAAVRRGDPPTQTVATTMNVARSTAARWVAAARNHPAGLLGPAQRGRAGEREEES
jgi:hypothetical protein